MFEGASAGPVRFESRHAVSLGSVTQPQPQGKAQAPTTRFKAVRQSPVVGRGLLNLGGCTHSGFGFRGDFMIDTSQCPASAITRMHSPLTGAAANTSRPDQAVVGVLTDELARRCKQLTWGVDVNRRATTLSIHSRGRVACLPTAAGGARQSLRQGQRSSPVAQSVDQVCMRTHRGAPSSEGVDARPAARAGARNRRGYVSRDSSAIGLPVVAAAGRLDVSHSQNIFFFSKKNKNEMKGRNLLLTKGSSPAGSPARHFAPPPAVVNPRRTRLRPR